MVEPSVRQPSVLQYIAANTPDTVVVDEAGWDFTILEIGRSFDHSLEEAFLTKALDYQHLKTVILQLCFQCKPLVFIFGSLGIVPKLVVRYLQMARIPSPKTKAFAKFCSLSAIIGSRHRRPHFLYLSVWYMTALSISQWASNALHICHACICVCTIWTKLFLCPLCSGRPPASCFHQRHYAPPHSHCAAHVSSPCPASTHSSARCARTSTCRGRTSFQVQWVSHQFIYPAGEPELFWSS